MNSFAVVILALSFVLTLGCTQTSTTSPRNGVSTDGATASDWSHDGIWSTIHGKVYSQASPHNKKSCVHCHDGSTTGYNTGPQCTSCHPVFPHSIPFVAKKHGGIFLQDKVGCAKCHGQSLAGGDAAPSCQKCHTTYPHSEGWDDPKNHGMAYVNADADGKKFCSTCHQESSPSGVSCNMCHVQVPHSEEFVGGAHKNDFLKDKAACIGCHGKDLSGGAVGVACDMCHDKPKLEVKP